MNSVAFLITAFWSLCVLVGAFLILSGQPPWVTAGLLLTVAVLQAGLVRGKP